MDPSSEPIVLALLAAALAASWPRFATMFVGSRVIMADEGVALTLAASLSIGAIGLALAGYGLWGGGAICLAGIAIGEVMRRSAWRGSVDLVLGVISLILFLTLRGAAS